MQEKPLNPRAIVTIVFDEPELSSMKRGNG
jgi:hypothetical protein